MSGPRVTVADVFGVLVTLTAVFVVAYAVLTVVAGQR